MAADDREVLAQALQESEERLRAVLETAVNPIIVMGEDRLIRLVNPAAVTLFGFSAEEMVGQNVKMLMPAPYQEQHDSYVENYARSGVKKIIGSGRDVTALRKDGSTFPIHLSIGEANLPSGRIFTAVILDLSEQKRLEHILLETSEREQQRIGQDIHDDICQQLTGVACVLKVLRKESDQKDEYGQSWDQLEKMVRETNTHARCVARGLVPVVLESEGLRAALADLASSKSQLFDLDCSLVATDDAGSGVTETQSQIHLFRVAQEAIRNAANHGKAKTIELHLTQSENEVVLTISDDGIGIAEERGNHSNGGMGLITMKHRARMMSGTLQIGNRDGGGTIVECKIPLK